MTESTQASPSPLSIPRATALRAIRAHDARQTGRFVYGVQTTGVYCQPWCRSRPARSENIRLFATPAEAEQAGFRACKRCTGAGRTDAALERAHALLAAGAPEAAMRLKQLASEVGLSPSHLQRLFRRRFGVSPQELTRARRDQAWRRELRRGRDVTSAMIEAGFASTSRAHQSSELGVTPSDYRKGAAGGAITYALARSPLGRMLVACSERGLCQLAFGESDAALSDQLRREYPKAALRRDDRGMRAAVRGVTAAISRFEGAGAIPLDLAGTVFQQRVWRALRSIPRGKTRTYRQIAADLGDVRAARAVAGACARNPIAVLIPCHRVVRGDGGLGGYRWGLQRKASILSAERQ
jgi:AraC family transcriptional regulator of adaptative response/methylated-DNA-[protein]-cysteine methyltransferase